MPVDDILTFTVRQLLERSVKLILQESTHFPRFDKRIDLEFDVTIDDRKIGRPHPVRAKIRVTAISELFSKREPRQYDGEG